MLLLSEEKTGKILKPSNKAMLFQQSEALEKKHFRFFYKISSQKCSRSKHAI
jgi:hypothetical protein